MKELNVIHSMTEEVGGGRLVGSLAFKNLKTNKSRNQTRNYFLSIRMLWNWETIVWKKLTMLLKYLKQKQIFCNVEFSNVNKMDRTAEQSNEILEVLSSTERICRKLYRKIHTIGRGSENLLVLLPQTFINLLRL